MISSAVGRGMVDLRGGGSFVMRGRSMLIFECDGKEVDFGVYGAVLSEERECWVLKTAKVNNEYIGRTAMRSSLRNFEGIRRDARRASRQHNPRESLTHSKTFVRLLNKDAAVARLMMSMNA